MNPAAKKNRLRSLRFSLQFKLTFPILIIASCMLFWLFDVMAARIRDEALEYHKNRLVWMAEIFAHTLQEPLIKGDEEALSRAILWILQRPHVLQVRIEDPSGKRITEGIPGMDQVLTVSQGESSVKEEAGQDRDLIEVPIKKGEHVISHLSILFSRGALEAKLRQIFSQSLWVAFSMVILLSLLMAGISWLAFHPLFSLKKTAQDILGFRDDNLRRDIVQVRQHGDPRGLALDRQGELQLMRLIGQSLELGDTFDDHA